MKPIGMRLQVGRVGRENDAFAIWIGESGPVPLRFCISLGRFGAAIDFLKSKEVNINFTNSRWRTWKRYWILGKA